MSSGSVNIALKLDSSQYLNGKNYFVWKELVYGIIEDAGLEMTLQEQWVKAAQRGGDMEAANRKSRRVVRIILMNMTFEFANEFIGFDQAYELWQALENRFEVLSATEIKNLVIEIATMRYNGNVASMARRCDQIKKQLKDNNVSVGTVIDILSGMNNINF